MRLRVDAVEVQTVLIGDQTPKCLLARGMFADLASAKNAAHASLRPLYWDCADGRPVGGRLDGISPGIPLAVVSSRDLAPRQNVRVEHHRVLESYAPRRELSEQVFRGLHFLDDRSPSDYARNQNVKVASCPA